MKFYLLKSANLLSLILLFVASFLTTYDLSFYEYGYPLPFYQFSKSTIAVVLVFLLCISLIFIKKEDDFFLSLMFWLVLTSGLAILRFTILDEIILLIACIVIIIKSILKKNIKIKKKFNFSEILFLLFILIIFFQSIFGLFNSIKSLRFILIYFSIATLFFFFISNKKFSCNLEKIVNICSNAVIIHYLITIFIWFINYYYLKTPIGLFFGNMTGIGFAGVGYIDAPGIIGIFCSLYILFEKTNLSIAKPVFIIFLIIITLTLADSRASLLLLFIFFLSLLFIIIFNFKKKKILYFVIIIFIVTFSFIFIKQNFFKSLEIGYLEAALKTFDVKEGMTKMGYLGKDVAATANDTGRFLYLITSFNTIIEKPFVFIFGCGTYGFWPCSADIHVQTEILWNVNYLYSGGFNFDDNEMNIRVTALPAIIIEHGFIIIFIIFIGIVKFLFYTMKITNNKNKNFSYLVINSSLILILIFWSYFSYYQDVVYLYILFIPGFLYKLELKKK
jgi:hypothetical protein